jgi:hypothetical protein
MMHAILVLIAEDVGLGWARDERVAGAPERSRTPGRPGIARTPADTPERRRRRRSAAGGGGGVLLAGVQQEEI